MVSNSGIYITWPQLLYVGILVLSFYVVELIFFWLRHGRKDKVLGNASLQQQVEALRQELDATKVRLVALAAQLQIPADETSLPNAAIFSVYAAAESPTVAESPYAQAIRLAEQGVAAPEVAMTCGISRGEADLIVAIYRSAERS